MNRLSAYALHLTTNVYIYISITQTTHTPSHTSPCCILSSFTLHVAVQDRSSTTIRLLLKAGSSTSCHWGWVKTYYTIWVCISVYQLFWCSPKKVQRFDPQPFVDERACPKDFWNPQSETLLDMTCCNLYKIMQSDSSCL